MKGINAWHTYMTDHYQFGKETGEQGYESAGDSRQRMRECLCLSTDLTPTPALGKPCTRLMALQAAAALAATVNGGTYYQPSFGVGI